MTYEEAWNNQKKFMRMTIRSLKDNATRTAEDKAKILTLETLLMRMEDEEDYIDEY